MKSVIHSSFSKNLMLWYQRSARSLPWRETEDPYKIWISEVMLQQTTVNAVIPYFERWIKRFPDVKSVARSSQQTILKHWQGLGYYSRARNIHATANIITKVHKGVFPSDFEILRKLPGFGPYTTGAVLSIAFDQRQPIIDANVRRVVMRQLKLPGPADARHDKTIGDFLLRVMPQKGNRYFNQALMELGALICRPLNPLCLSCPVSKTCLAYQEGMQDVIPTPKKQVIKDVSASIAVIVDKKKYFIQRRPPKGLFADLWEFPGGKVEPGEKPQEALHREIKEELAIEIEVLEPLPKLVQYYTQFKAVLNIWLCRPLQPPQVDQTHKWVSLKELAKYPMPSGSARIVEYLRKGGL